jgi:hypothetical protein
MWPGLPQLWAYGSWAGLFLALATAILLDILILASFGWTELINPNLRITCWGAFGVYWIFASGWSARTLRRRAEVEKIDLPEDAFTEALDYYLKGDYYQTEHVLEGLLQRNLRDADARLMLATLMRRTGRLDEAAGQLDTLSRFEGAEKWGLEIRQERERLTEAKEQKATAA